MTNIKETPRIKLVTKTNAREIEVSPCPFNLKNYKRAFTTRNINSDVMATLVTGKIKPNAGDLVLCEVTRLRQHCRTELINGRRSRMFVNDKIIVCFGNRYAPDQFEACVPDDLSPCHLVAGGGIAAKMSSKNPKVKPATEIKPIGLIADVNGEVINLIDYTSLNLENNKNNVPIYLVAGSSMNAGKTTTVANIIKGLRFDGYRVGAAKVTGTGSGGDLWHFLDAGVSAVVDFTDAGYVSTYKVDLNKIVMAFQNMVLHLKNQGVDVIVIEVADGILQPETESLLSTKIIQNLTTSVVFSAGDSSSSLYGVQWLENKGYDVIAISGIVSSIPLAKQEVETKLHIPVLKKTELTQAGFGHSLIENYKYTRNLNSKNQHNE